ncbi:MAG: tetratricopeptide repeat protein, partial [Phycisphaeraceae bacterium]|nr:tetratricopeptide repeat protein [Phycisphaeraceae bacterium]
EGFGGRALCLSRSAPPKPPYEVGVWVKLDDEKGAAGLAFCSDGRDRHYGFYPSGGNIRLTRFEGPSVFTWKVLEEFRTPHYRPGQWNHLKVRIEKEKLIGYVNDQKVIESTDTAFRDGVAGLAKFRQTQARFKRFETDERIGPMVPNAKLRSQVEKQLQNLPPLGRLDPKALDGPVFQTEGSVQVIRDRARRLALEAERLKKLASDVHVRGVVRELKKTLKTASPGALSRAALLVAKIDHEELDPDAYVERMEELAEEASEGLDPAATVRQKQAALEATLFEKHGFHGSRTEYGHRANSHLNRVIDDREGLPLTLSVLYIELARRMGFEAEGIGLPGHFVVRVESRYVDVFNRGAPLKRRDLQAIVRLHTHRPLRPEHLEAQGPRQIILRMLNNLMQAAQEAEDRAASLRYLEAMVALSPEDVGLRGMRGVVRFQTGRRAAGIADLDWILKKNPPHLDLERVRQMRDRFEAEARAASD